MVTNLFPGEQINNFKVEDAKPEDVEAMRAIVKDAWLKLYPNEEYGITREDISAIDWYNPEAIAGRKKEITENRETVHVWVVKNEKGEVVGFCKTSKLSDTLGEIDAMYVLSEIQGKGFGKKLMEKALEWLGPNLDVKLKVVKYNTTAIEFYKRIGFKETGNPVSYGWYDTKLPSGKDIPRVELIKPKISHT